MNNKPDQNVSQTPKSSGSLIFKVFGYALLFGVILSGGFFLFCKSDAAIEFMFERIAKNASVSGGSLEYAGLKGNLLDGIELSEIKARLPKNSFHLKGVDLNARFDFSGLLSKAGIGVSLKCSEIIASGRISIPGFDLIPPPPALSCIISNSLPLFVKEVDVENVECYPNGEKDLGIFLQSISLSLPESPDNKTQKIKFAFYSKFKERKFAVGTYSGDLQQKIGKMTGRASACIVDQKIESEILIEEKKKDLKISGYVSSSTIDLAKISRWLIPIWQDSFPFGFDGFFSFNGSWMFSRGDGFFSNFSGKMEKVRVVALGFFYPMLELNAKWKYFNNEMIFEDSGSTMLGFPATFSGRVETPPQAPPRWFIDFSADAINVEELISNLPWGLKYSFALPPMKGVAAVSLKVRKKAPEFFANIISSKMIVGEARREVDFKMNFKMKAFAQPEFVLNFKQDFYKGLPKVFNSFSGNFFKLSESLGQNISFSGVMKGHDFLNAKITGQFLGNSREYDLEGIWKDGTPDLKIKSEVDYFSNKLLPADLFLTD